jgi:geranylgeranyl pyrophosphate synthase
MKSSLFDLPDRPSDWTSFQIRSALENTVLAGGKRFRPQLIFLMGRALGLSENEVTPFARTAELTHAATLAHDDVVDEASTRRGRPTLNQSFSNAHAVLAGDFLLARAVSEIVCLGHPKILEDLTQVIESLCEGEWLQLESRDVVNDEFASWENIATRKTSSLISWCLVTPARVFGCSQVSELAALSDCGQALGLAFQMRDDILDFNSSASGKDDLKDWTEGLLNSVTVHILSKQIQGDRGVVLRTWKAALRGRNPVNVPWSESEMKLAVEEIHNRIRLKVFVASRRLEDFSEMIRARTGKPLESRALAELNAGMATIARRET